MSRKSSRSAFPTTLTPAPVRDMTRRNTRCASDICTTIPLRRLPKRKPTSNNSSSNSFSQHGFGSKRIVCTRRCCKICQSDNYIPLSDDLIQKLEQSEFFDAITSDELAKYKSRYLLEREHALHKGPAAKWLTKLKLCADAHEAILKSYVQPPPIVIQKYNAHALISNKPLIPEGYTRHREDREFKVRNRKQRHLLGLDVPSKPSKSELSATSVFSWSVGYHFNMHASRHVYYRKASVRFPLANHAFGLTAVVDIKDFINSMLVTTSLSVGRHFTTQSLVPLVGDSASVIVATFQAELHICVTKRMLTDGTKTQCDDTTPQIVRVIHRSCFRIARFTPSCITNDQGQFSDLQIDHKYWDTSDHDWGPALQTILAEFSLDLPTIECFLMQVHEIASFVKTWKSINSLTTSCNSIHLRDM